MVTSELADAAAAGTASSPTARTETRKCFMGVSPPDASPVCWRLRALRRVSYPARRVSTGSVEGDGDTSAVWRTTTPLLLALLAVAAAGTAPAVGRSTGAAGSVVIYGYP